MRRNCRIIGQLLVVLVMPLAYLGTCDAQALSSTQKVRSTAAPVASCQMAEVRSSVKDGLRILPVRRNASQDDVSLRNAAREATVKARVNQLGLGALVKV